MGQGDPVGEYQTLARASVPVREYLDARTAGVDGPQRLHAHVADAHIPIIQIDRRVAMSGDEPDLVAVRERPLARHDIELTVLVGDSRTLDVSASPQPRHAAFAAVGL